METIIYKVIQDKDCWDYLTIIGSLVSVIILSCTFLLAWNINKKINKPILEKQLNTVYELIEKLQNTKITADIYSENGLLVSKESKLFHLNFFQIISYDLEAKYKEYNIIINRENYEKLSFINYKNNPFIPKDIADILEKIQINLNKESKIDINNKVDFTEVINKNNVFIGDIKKDYTVKKLADPEIFKYSNKYIHNLNDFINILKEIHDKIRKWIKTPSNPAKSLNLK